MFLAGSNVLCSLLGKSDARAIGSVTATKQVLQWKTADEQRQDESERDKTDGAAGKPS
jgi:hypothetical protein